MDPTIMIAVSRSVIFLSQDVELDPQRCLSNVSKYKIVIPRVINKGRLYFYGLNEMEKLVLLRKKMRLRRELLEVKTSAHSKTFWNTPNSFRLFVLIHFALVDGAYIVPTEVLSISTFNSSTSIDTNTQNALGDQQTPADPNFSAITAIRNRIFPGQDDAAVGAGQTYWGFPPPTAFQGGINTEAEPQDGPCVARTDGNCSAFIGSNGEAGPITIEFRASPVTLKYKLIDTGIRTPYCYLDHNTKLLWCMAGKGPEGKQSRCSYGPAQYVSYDNNFLINPWRQNLNGNSDPTEVCRGTENSILGNYVIYDENKNEDYITPGCFACPILIDEEYGGRLTTLSHFCPFHAGHTTNPPTYQESSMKHGCANDSSTNCNKCKSDCRPKGPITADAAGLEPYYYWCYGMQVGFNSDWYYQNKDSPNVLKGWDVNAGIYNDFLEEYETAYQCTLSQDFKDNCPPYKFVSELLAQGLTKCTIGDSKDPICGQGSADCSLVVPCNNTQTTQVTSAINFLTASCDANDSQESRSGVSYGDAGSDPKGFKCPGDRWGHVRPQPISPADGYHLARCSAGCNTPNTITNSDLPTKNTNRYIKNYVVSSVMDEKGTIELGPISCKVYRVDSQPRASITLDVIITAPDGDQETITLGTDSLTFGVAEFGSANFSARINRVATTSAGVGEQIEGLIVICGTDENVDVNMGGRDVTGCETLNAPEVNITDRDSCSVPRGVFRGVFPNAAGVEDPNVNPWPQLVQQMKSDYLERCGDPSTPSAGCINSVTIANQKAQSCAVPTPMYTSILNCGRRTSWYFVPEAQISDYGTDCGQLGFRNKFAASSSGAQFMCQQGGTTCTPGFGRPRSGTNAASTSVRSPCQQVGGLTGFQYDTQDMTDGCKNRNVAVPTNLPPTWRYGKSQDYTSGDYEPQTDTTDSTSYGIPSMWVHRTALYSQPTTSEGAQLTLDVEIYTNTFFGGDFVSCAGGKIADTDLLYCQTVVSEAKSGSIAVEFCNTSPDSGGRYSAATVCYLPQSVVNGDLLDTLTITTDPPIEFDLGPGECDFKSWGFEVTGPVKVDEVYCTTTLSAGGPCITYGALAEIEYSCDVKVPTYINTGRRSTIATFDAYECPDMAIFCKISSQSPYEEIAIYIILIALFIVANVFVSQAFLILYYRRQVDKSLQRVAEDRIRAEVSRNAHQEENVRSIVQQSMKQNQIPK